MVENKLKNLKWLLTTTYFVFMVVYLLIRDVTPLYFLISHPALSVIIFAVGFAIIVWDLLTDANCIKGRPVDFFAAFIVICVISSIINYKYGVAGNIKCIGAMVLEYFVFFSVGAGKDRKKMLRVVLNALIIALFILIFISVLMYIFSVDYTVNYRGERVDQGYDTTYGRLWGVFIDPNAICYIALVSFFASFYFMYAYRKIWAYVLYGVNALFQMLFIMLSVSRSALLIMVAIPIVSAIYPIFTFIKANFKKAICSLIVTILMSGMLYGIYQGLNFGTPYVKYAVMYCVGNQGRETIVDAFDNFYVFSGTPILNQKENHVENPKEEVKPEVEEIVRKDEKEDISNGRFARWKGGWEVFKTTPIFGTSPRNAVEIAKERTPDTVMGKYGWITHCAYLEVLVNSGILGALALMGSFIYIAVLFLKSALKKAFSFHTYIVFLAFLIVAAGIFFISDVFFVFTLNSLLFLFLMGYLFGWSDHSDNSILYGAYCAIKRRFSDEKSSDIRG